MSLRVVVAVCSLLLTACRCTRMSGEADELAFTRCSQAAAPKERSLRSGELDLNVEERSLIIKARPGLRIAMFTGPVGAALSRPDLALLASKKPGLVMYLGGLGDDVGAASSNLASIAALRVPTLFIAGGSDRLPVIEEAFESLDGETAQLVMHASGLRTIRIGNERLAVVSGSPLGRYALDGDACGFGLSDLEDVRETIAGEKSARTWLLSWAAPSGWGLSHAANHDVGSPELFALAQAISAQGGFFAYPETQVGSVVRDAKRTGAALVVPRLGRTGASRADGGRLASSLQIVVLTADGLLPSP